MPPILDAGRGARLDRRGAMTYWRPDPRLIVLATAVLAGCVPGSDGRSHPSNDPDDRPASAEVSFVPSGVTLNYNTGEMEIRGVLTREGGGAPPARVWFWGYFINPTE